MSATIHNVRWLIRRELMEHRRLLGAPAVLGIAVVGLNIALLVSRLIRHDQPASDLPAITPGQAFHIGSTLAWAMYTTLTLFALALGASLLSYGLGCLFDERRDRSVLFWKSLPVTDTQTVVAKFIVALGLLPLAWTASALIAGWLSIAVYVVPAAFAPVELGALFAQTHIAALTIVVIVAFPVYLLSLIPAVGWVMLCSATARRHPALIAFIVPALFAVVGVLGWPNPMWDLLLGRILPSGFLTGMTRLEQPGTNLVSALAPIFQPLTQAQLWLGVLFGLICLAAAIAYRRRYTVLV